MEVKDHTSNINLTIMHLGCHDGILDFQLDFRLAEVQIGLLTLLVYISDTTSMSGHPIKSAKTLSFPTHSLL